MDVRIGFVGLGNMGAAMAANLIEAGHEVTVYNRSRGKVDALTERGARAAASVADACRGDVVITMLANDEAVEGFAFGAEGIIASLAQGATHVSCSTISVSLAERLTAAHAEADQRFVSAPVFGRPEAAKARKLFVVAAGPAAHLDALASVFDAVGQRTFTVAEQPSTANLIKLSGNFLIMSVIETLGEAMALVAKTGVDKRKYLEILTSTLFGAPIYKTYGELIAGGRFEPAGFAATLGKKDIGLVLAAAEDLRVPMPVAGLIRDRFLALLARGGDDLDWSAIGALSQWEAGGPSPADT